MSVWSKANVLEEEQNYQDSLPAPEQRPNQCEFSEKHWHKSSLVLSQTYNVSAWKEEQYHLLLLRHYAKGVTFYKGMRTIDGEE